MCIMSIKKIMKKVLDSSSCVSNRCLIYLPTHHCRLLWQQMLTEPLCKLQDSRPAWEK